MSRNISVILSLRDQFSGGIQRAAANTNQFERQARSASETLRNMGDRANKTFTGIAKAAAGLGAIGGIALFKSSMDTYTEFEQSMANVKALTNATDETFQKLQNAALEMGKKTSKSAKEAADALGYMSLAGWDAETSITALEPVLRLSEAGGLDLARTSDLVTDSMSSLGLKVDQLPDYLDKLAQSSRKSNTAIDQMMDAYLKVGGTMNRLNVPMEESATVLGTLANRGLKGAEAGQALSSIMVNLTAPTGQAATALEELNFSAFDSQGNFKGLENVLIDLQEKMSGLSAQEKESMVAMIAGKEQLKTFSAMMDGLSNEYFDLKESIASSDGALMEMAATMNATLQGAFKRAESAIDDFKINMMMQLAPYLTKMIDTFAEKLPAATEKFSVMLKEGIEKATPTLKALGGALNWLGQHAETIIPAVISLTGAWIAYNATMAASNTLRNINAFGAGIMSMGRSINFLTTATVTGKKSAILLKVLTGALGLLKAAFLANPIGMFVLALSAVAAGLMIAYKKSETFRTAVQGLWAKIQTGVAIIKTDVMPVIENLKILLLMLWDNVLKPIGQTIGGAFFEAFQVVFPAIATVVSFAFDQMLTVIETVSGALKGITDFLIGVFTGNWKKAWEGIKNIFTSLWDGVLSTWDNLVKRFKGGVSDVKDSASDAIRAGSKETKTRKTSSPAMPGHATGTSYFYGGMTKINEGNRGEIVNLPNGTQIIPHDISKKAVKSNGGVSVNITIQGNMIGEEQYINKMGYAIGQKINEAIYNS